MVSEAQFGDVHYRSTDRRLDLFARDYPATRDSKNFPPLLMMHGLTRNSADFEPLINRLDSKRRIIAPDQRGRGLSAYEKDHGNYRPEIYAEDMWTLLDRLEIERVICIGTSMGGLISMVMGAASPERIAGIVLNDVGPEVSPEGLDRIRSYVGHSEPMAGWSEAAARCQAINAGAMDGFTSDDWMMFARRTCHEMTDARIRFSYDPAISDSLAPQDPATIPADLWNIWQSTSDIPVLALRGEKSDILTRATVERMAVNRRARFSSVEVPGRGHAPVLDEPVAVEAIKDFIENCR